MNDWTDELAHEERQAELREEELRHEEQQIEDAITQQIEDATPK